MGPMEISKGARHYSMSVSEYIGSIIASGGGDNKGILPWYLICARENSRAIEEHTEREREIDRKNHEIQMQAMRKKHEIQMETMKRQEKASVKQYTEISGRRRRRRIPWFALLRKLYKLYAGSE